MSDFPGLYLSDIHHLVKEQERLIPQRINYDLPVVKKKRFVLDDREIEDVRIGRFRSDTDDGESREWTRVWKKRLSFLCSIEYQDVDFLPNGDIIAVLDGKLCVYDEDGQSKPVPFPVDKSSVDKVVVHRPSSTVAVIGYPRKITLFTQDKEVKSNEFDKCEREVRSEQTHTLEESDIPKQTVDTIKINQSKTSGLKWRATTVMENMGRCAAFTPEGDLVVGGDDILMKYSISGDLVWDVRLDYTCGDLTVSPDGTIIACPDTYYNSLSIYNGNGIKLRDVSQPKMTLFMKVFDLFKTGYPGHEQSLFINSKVDIYLDFNVLSDLVVLNMEGGFESGAKVLSRLEQYERVISGNGGVCASIDKNRMVVGSVMDLMLYKYKTKPSEHADIPSTHGILEPFGL